jgi:hypothetical protein
MHIVVAVEIPLLLLLLLLLLWEWRPSHLAAPKGKRCILEKIANQV